MLRATTRFGDDLRPNYQAEHLIAQRADSTPHKRGARLEIVHCPGDAFDRGALFWPLEVLMTVAYNGFPTGTTLKGPKGELYTVRGRALYDAAGRRQTNQTYETELASTWVVVSSVRPPYHRGDILRTEDVAEALRHGTLENARLVVPVRAVQNAGETVTVRAGRLMLADDQELRGVRLTAAGKPKAKRPGAPAMGQKGKRLLQ